MQFATTCAPERLYCHPHTSQLMALPNPPSSTAACKHWTHRADVLAAQTISIAEVIASDGESFGRAVWRLECR